jgi:hypothetical protein
MAEFPRDAARANAAFFEINGPFTTAAVTHVAEWRSHRAGTGW